jgi:hypothetical protein
MPKTCTEYREKLNEPEFKEDLIEYVESVVSSEFPTQLPMHCPSCQDETSKLEPLVIPSKYHRPPRDDPGAPNIAKCSLCAKVYTYAELFSSILADMEGVNEDDIHKLISSDEIIGASASGRDLAGLQLTLVIQKTQTHGWKHCRSCFKKTTRVKNGKSCRFCFPKCTVEFTVITDANRVLIKRANGNQWVNTFSPLFMRAFKFNHDIKFLTCGEGPGVTYYCLLYATKAQKHVEDAVTLYLNAFDKAKAKQALDLDAPREVRGRRTITSILTKLTAPQEMGEPLAALYLLRGSPFYYSHDFVDIYIAKAIKYRVQEDVEVNLVYDAKNSEFSGRLSQYHDYVYRPEELEDLSFYDFVVRLEKRKGIIIFLISFRDSKE